MPSQKRNISPRELPRPGKRKKTETGKDDRTSTNKPKMVVGDVCSTGYVKHRVLYKCVTCTEVHAYADKLESHLINDHNLPLPTAQGLIKEVQSQAINDPIVDDLADFIEKDTTSVNLHGTDITIGCSKAGLNLKEQIQVVNQRRAIQYFGDPAVEKIVGCTVCENAFFTDSTSIIRHLDQKHLQGLSKYFPRIGATREELNKAKYFPPIDARGGLKNSKEAPKKTRGRSYKKRTTTRTNGSSGPKSTAPLPPTSFGKDDLLPMDLPPINHLSQKVMPSIMPSPPPSIDVNAFLESLDSNPLPQPVPANIVPDDPSTFEAMGRLYNVRADRDSEFALFVDLAEAWGRMSDKHSGFRRQAIKEWDQLIGNQEKKVGEVREYYKMYDASTPSQRDRLQRAVASVTKDLQDDVKSLQNRQLVMVNNLLSRPDLHHEQIVDKHRNLYNSRLVQKKNKHLYAESKTEILAGPGAPEPDCQHAYQAYMRGVTSPVLAPTGPPVTNSPLGPPASAWESPIREADQLAPNHGYATSRGPSRTDDGVGRLGHLIQSDPANPGADPDDLFPGMPSIMPQ